MEIDIGNIIAAILTIVFLSGFTILIEMDMNKSTCIQTGKPASLFHFDPDCKTVDYKSNDELRCKQVCGTNYFFSEGGMFPDTCTCGRQP